MKKFFVDPDDYTNLASLLEQQSQQIDIVLMDHLGGFDQELNNELLTYLNQQRFHNKIFLEYTIDQRLKNKYPNCRVCFSTDTQIELLEQFKNYNQHPSISFNNFVCSFNGSDHVGRKLLLGALYRRGWFDPAFSTKNIAFDVDVLYGHIKELEPQQVDLYAKFFCDFEERKFYRTVSSVDYRRENHASNIMHLESRLTQSFLHVVSETISTSYYPFVTEKFLYSVVTRGLFLGNAAPGWHSYLEKYYGFKRFTKLFDYTFDNVTNPIERLIKLLDMISKFSNLSKTDWQDLYLLEQDTIEYNYDHYFSGAYIKQLKLYE